MPFADLNQVRLYYETSGDPHSTSPVLMVNGWTISCEYWRPLVSKLEALHYCIRYDARGFGRSQPLAATVGVEIDDHADDLHELIRLLGLRDVNLIGHGIGVWSSLLCARNHPQNINSLTAIAPELEAEKDDKTPELPSLWQQASLLLKDLAGLPMLRNLVAWRYRQAPEPFRTRLFDDFAAADRRSAFHMLASCMDQLNRERLLRTFGEVSLPVLLVRGTEDRVCPATTLREFFNIIRAGKMATIRGCGHFPMLEFTEEFGQLLLDFYAAHGGPARAPLPTIRL